MLISMIMMIDDREMETKPRRNEYWKMSSVGF